MLYPSAVATFFLVIALSSSAVALLDVSKVARSLRGLEEQNGLSREELRCSVDSQSMYGDNPVLQQILLDLKDNINVEVSEAANSMELSFKTDYVVELEAACKGASGLFVYLNETDFVCQYMGKFLDLDVDNFVQCLADTPECVGLNQIKFMEEIWDAMGLECREKGQPTSPHTPKPYNSSNRDGLNVSASTNGQPNSYLIGVLAAKLSFLLLCAGTITYFIRHSDGQRPRSPAIYEMSIQEDNTLT
jgi:hypothetical protein